MTPSWNPLPYRAALAGVAFILSGAPAPAHVSLAVTQSPPDTSYRGTVQINHGCNGAATTRISVRIPEGMIGVRPMPKAGWTLTTRRAAYAATYSDHGRPVSEGVTEVTWAGGPLADDHFDEFVFVGHVTGGFKPGDVAYFPVEQDCTTGAAHWVEIPAAHQSPGDLRSPAPALRIVAASAAVASAPQPVPSRVVQFGTLSIETPWLRATPGGARVAGGYVRVTNTGPESDRLVGASIPIAARAEVHATSLENGISRMAPVAGGLEIRPGETVELKPGGRHLMFMDLTGGLHAGETVAGTLVFEKAGAAAVTFSVGAIGAPGPATGGHVH